MNSALHINNKILNFIRKRENAFRIVQAAGKTHVPYFSKKLAAITLIRNTMQAARQYDLTGQCHSIIEVQEAIQFILPSTYSRFQNQRREIIELLNYCRQTLADKFSNQQSNPTRQ